MALIQRDYDGAIKHYRDALEIDPYFYKAHTSMGRAYIQKGMYDRGIEMLEKGRALSGDPPTILAALGQAHALSGRTEKARELLARWLKWRRAATCNARASLFSTWVWVSTTKHSPISKPDATIAL